MDQNLSKLKIIKEFLFDLFFPKFCVGCGKEGEWVCACCQSEVIEVATQVCPDCGKISKLGKYCPRCRKKYHHRLEGIIVAAYYEEGPIKEAIHNLKYNNVTELGDYLGKFLLKALSANIDNIKGELILTAVPMHFLKKAQRGYNQAEILAEFVAKKINENQPEAGPPLAENFKIIKKIRKTKSQVSKSGKKRRENLKKSFKIIDKFAIKNRTVIIVDDVTTTGTTLEECAKVLRLAGAKKVWGLVIARG